MLDQYLAKTLGKRGIPSKLKILLVNMLCTNPLMRMNIENVRVLLREVQANLDENKLLVLGTSQSGKTTMINQLKVLFQKPYTLEGKHY